MIKLLKNKIIIFLGTLLAVFLLPKISQAAIPSTLGWYEIPNTKINDVCACTHGFPEVCGATSCASITDAWTSAAFDTTRDRLLIFGGGHNNYYGNEVYALNLSTNPVAMTRIKDPTSNFTSCAAQNSDGTPTSRHTYDTLVYLPTQDKMFLHGGYVGCESGITFNDTWLLNISNTTWERKTPSGTLPTDYYIIDSAYDTVTGKIFMDDTEHLHTYDPVTNAFAQVGNYDRGGRYWFTAIIDPANRQYVVVGNGSVWHTSIANGSSCAQYPMSTSGGTALVNSNYPGLAWDSDQNKIVGWSGGNTAYVLNPDYNNHTGTWTPITYTGGPGSANTTGTYKRFSYSPTSKVFVIVNQTSQNAYTLRLYNYGSGDTIPPSTPTNLTATAISSSQINLAWTASTDNVGVTGYKIYRGGAQIGTSATNSYLDSGLNPSTTYTYNVSAYDAAGNNSAQSSSVSATTQAQGVGRIIHIYPGTDVFGPAAQNLIAGDTLIVHQGTYTETNRMSIQVQGTASAPIVIKGADGEVKPVITRSTSAAVQNTINIEGSATYLTIKGLEIIGNGGDGFALNGSLSYITLEDNYIHDVDVGIGMHTNMNNIIIRKNHITNTGIDSGTGEGMYVGCNYASCSVTDSLIENNWIHDNLVGTTQGDGIEVKYGSHSNIIRDNVIYNMFYPGIFVYGSPSGAINTVEGNVIWNCLEGIYAVADAVVKNNIVFNSGTGLSLYGHSQVASMRNVTAVNNTLYNNDDGLYIRWGGTNMTLANNAIYSAGKTAINSSYGISGTVISNYIEGSVDISIDNSKIFSGGSAATAFVNTAANNFWPSPSSILRNNANASYVPADDFNRTVRTSPYDIGAYETQGLASNPGWQIMAGFKTIGTGTPDTTPPAAPTGITIQ